TRGDTRLSRREALQAAMAVIQAYETTLSAAMLDALASIPGSTVVGVADRARLDSRVPTFAFTIAGRDPAAIADALADRGVGVRSGHMYTPRLMRRLGLLPQGVVRASLVHYNTHGEIARFRDELERIVRG